MLSTLILTHCGVIKTGPEENKLKREKGLGKSFLQMTPFSLTDVTLSFVQ